MTTRRMQIPRWLGWCVWVALVLAVSGRWVGRAEPAAQANDDPRFTGVSTGMERDDLSVSRRHFEAGARSAWHHHSRGQVLFVEEGRGRTQKAGQPLHELAPGETDYTGPDVIHWHGASGAHDFVQIAIGFGGEITWLEKVTDAQYEGRADR